MSSDEQTNGYAKDIASLKQFRFYAIATGGIIVAIAAFFGITSWQSIDGKVESAINTLTEEKVTPAITKAKHATTTAEKAARDANAAAAEASAAARGALAAAQKLQSTIAELQRHELRIAEIDLFIDPPGGNGRFIIKNGRALNPEGVDGDVFGSGIVACFVTPIDDIERLFPHSNNNHFGRLKAEAEGSVVYINTEGIDGDPEPVECRLVVIYKPIHD